MLFLRIISVETFYQTKTKILFKIRKEHQVIFAQKIIDGDLIWCYCLTFERLCLKIYVKKYFEKFSI